MLPIDTGCLGRPHKRPRGSSSFTELSPDSPPSTVSPTSSQTMPKASSQHLNHLSGPNLALESTSIARVARGDDRSRKLSCKECRRYFFLCSSYSHRLSNVSSCFSRLKLKASFSSRLRRAHLSSNVVVQCDRVFPCQVSFWLYFNPCIFAISLSVLREARLRESLPRR